MSRSAPLAVFAALLLGLSASAQHRTGGPSLSGVHNETADAVAPAEDSVVAASSSAALGEEPAVAVDAVGPAAQENPKDRAPAATPELISALAPVPIPRAPAAAARAAPAAAASSSGSAAEADVNCTGGNPRCRCVKKDARYNRYETAAAQAVARTFPGQPNKPEGMSDEQATAAICGVYNSFKTLGAGSACRAQADEIVFEDPRAPDPAYPTISVDVVTSRGAFWQNSIAACARGVQ